jgi:hypothetical protein
MAGLSSVGIRPDMVNGLGHAITGRAMGATIDIVTFRFDPVAYDSRAAGLALRSEHFNGTLETVESVHLAVDMHFKGIVVVVAAIIANSHVILPVSIRLERLQ